MQTLIDDASLRERMVCQRANGSSGCSERTPSYLTTKPCTEMSSMPHKTVGSIVDCLAANRILTGDRRTILSNTAFLWATTIATTGLGFAYWWLAARTFSAHDVGVAAAAVSGMTLLGYFAILGFWTLLIAVVHESGERVVAYVATATLTSAVVGSVLGLVALIAVPVISPELAGFAGDPAAQVLFPLGVGLTALTLGHRGSDHGRRGHPGARHGGRRRWEQRARRPQRGLRDRRGS